MQSLKVLSLAVVSFFLLSSALPSAAKANEKTENSDRCNALLNRLNNEYLAVHRRKEDLFFAKKMAHKNYVAGTFEDAEKNLKDFARDENHLIEVNEALRFAGPLSVFDRLGLEGFQRYFQTYAVPKGEVKAKLRQLIEDEEKLASDRQKMEIGFVDPITGQWREASAPKLQLIMGLDPEESRREAAYDALLQLEKNILALNFIEVVKLRNQIARDLGYEDFIDYKVHIKEGIHKKELYALLGDLELRTREISEKYLADRIKEKGNLITRPWNFSFLSSGSLSERIDRYFPMSTSLETWMNSFARMGIDFHRAELTIDLIDRPDKYSNGFMHVPSPAYLDAQRNFHPAKINFTATANPGQKGSGYSSLVTFLHEGGHAADFSAISMPAVVYGQEEPPTSVAKAEDTSMFIDDLIRDPEWLARYAKTSDGEAMPDALIEELVLSKINSERRSVREILLVPFMEKAIYEMSDAELTPENIIRKAREIENQFLGMPSGRPLMTIPHFLGGESAGSYYAYNLASLGVYQIQEYLKQKYGFIVDNPNIGPEFERALWREGNLHSFFDLIKDFTKKPLSADATIRALNRTPAEVRAAVREGLRRASVTAENSLIEGDASLLNATITIAHGDEVIVSSKDTDPSTFKKVFAQWINTLIEKNQKAEAK